MPAHKKIIIGTRGSALALKQSEIVSRALTKVEPSLTIEIRIIQTHGDTNQDSIPTDIVGKGWFTKEIEQALLTDEINLAVHSLKDMADEMQAGLTIGAYLDREDARDVLVTKRGESLEELPDGAIIGTDSIRRQVQIQALRTDLQMQSIRGNVPTRLEKLDSQNYDAIVLAAAGLKRLGIEDRITRYFEPHEMTPAPGQGILALQIQESNTGLQALLARINDPDVAQVAHIERFFSRAVGGGCKSPVGAYAFRDGDICRFIGMRQDASLRIIRKEVSAPWSNSTTLGEELAKEVLSI